MKEALIDIFRTKMMLYVVIILKKIYYINFGFVLKIQ